MSKIKLVVIDEHTLGYILPELPEYGQVLQGSILKGYPGNGWDSLMLLHRKVRLATKQDFHDYRCAWSTAYESDEYEFANDEPAT